MNQTACICALNKKICYFGCHFNNEVKCCSLCNRVVIFLDMYF